MKVLVCDPLADRALERLQEAGLEVTVRPGMTPEELAQELSRGHRAVVVRSATKLRKSALDSAQGVELIVRAGVGLDNIDVEAARAKGIRVENTPRASSDSVAELALGHMFALARHLPQASQSMREGRWEKKAFKGTEIQGKTLGVIGIGRIGQALARRALCLGMSVVGHDAYVDAPPLAGLEMVSKEELLQRADFVSLHVPQDPAGPVIGAEEFSLMKEGAYLVNCARGGVVDEEALLAALDEGKLAGAGLDVFAVEPPPNARLLQHPQVTLTPHVGAQTAEAQGRVGDEVVDILVAYARSA